MKLSDYSVTRNEGMGFGNEFSERRMAITEPLKVVTKACRVAVKEKVAERIVRQAVVESESVGRYIKDGRRERLLQ